MSVAVKVCQFCDSKSHDRKICPLTAEERREKLQVKNICFRCLGRTPHLTSECRTSMKCYRCEGQHHTYLCTEPKQPAGGATTTRRIDVTEVKQNAIVSVTRPTVEFLMIQMAQLGGEKLQTKGVCYIDGGAQRTFIRADVAQKLVSFLEITCINSHWHISSLSAAAESLYAAKEVRRATSPVPRRSARIEVRVRQPEAARPTCGWNSARIPYIVPQQSTIRCTFGFHLIAVFLMSSAYQLSRNSEITARYQAMYEEHSQPIAGALRSIFRADFWVDGNRGNFWPQPGHRVPPSDLGFSIQNPNFQKFQKPKVEIRNRVQLTIQKAGGGSPAIVIDAIETPQCTSTPTEIPNAALNDKLKEQGIQVNCKQAALFSDEVDILIGVDHYNKITTGRSKFINENLAAVHTILGWTLHGQTTQGTQLVAAPTQTNKITIIPSTDDVLHQFWELESIGVQHESMTDKGEEEILRKFNQTITWTGSNYSVQLPWTVSPDELADNYQIAEQRFLNLMCRFRKQPNLYLDQICLHWITNTSKRPPTFINNRAIEIREKSHVKAWKHVAGPENPADRLTRGIDAAERISDKLWWKGPKWLSEKQEYWPNTILEAPICPDESDSEADKDAMPEEPSGETHANSIQQKNNQNFIFPIFSSFLRTCRVWAWCHRFIHNSRQKPASGNIRQGALNAEELEKAKEKLIIASQQLHYAAEMKQLTNNKPLPGDSKLKLLNPFIDQQGVMRLRTRLQNSKDDQTAIQPIVLPQKFFTAA
uniref:Peptidase aspartic putative domain-containing protein n=1 Tax=Strigamia maritima TaxID=126957 RepID=T1JNA9_STRMM